MHDSVDVGRELIEHGAKMSSVDKAGDTPLHIAARYNSVGIVDLLIKNGADLNSLNLNKNTPLHESPSRFFCQSA